jgi:PKD repeat protein
MKNIFSIILSISIVQLFAQAPIIQRCATEEHFQQQLLLHPELAQKRADYEQSITENMANKMASRQSTATYIIPVVVHVIHQYGSENISDAQIEDQIRILNEDFQRKNPDSVNTPSAFVPIAGRLSIEFRLARLDPTNQCTNGIVRVASNLTNGTSSFSNRDDVKALSYWNANKYLNIWIVKTITPSVPNTIVLGYAQFPGLGSLSTEGLVLRSDATGSIGSVSPSSAKGRTATHEIGHCLGLRHIWGDDNGACTGSDLVGDTPNQANENTGCPSFPQVSCNNGPNGDLYSNYMDYVQDVCMNIFTAGQVLRMTSSLVSAAGGRNNLWQASNLISTGTNVPNSPIVCKPKCDFISRTEVCAGSTLAFGDKSWNTSPTSWNWTFQGGTPDTSTSQNPVVQYTTPGIYDVKLVVSNSAGTDSLTKIGHILVKSGVAPIQLPNYFETFPPNVNLATNNYRVVDPNNDISFFPYTGAGIGDNSSVSIDNSINSPGFIDYMYIPNINFTNAPLDSKLSFYLSYQRDISPRTDNLRVQFSLNCGLTWVTRYNKSANSTSPLHTVAAINTSGFFSPNGPSQWRKEDVNISGYPGAATASNMEIRFVFTADPNIGSGLPLYIDSVSLTSLSLGNANVYLNQMNASVYPNPSEGNFTIEFYDNDIENLTLEVVDLLGRKTVINKSDLIQYSFHTYVLDTRQKLTNGTYMLKLKSGNKYFNSKISILKE